MVWNVHMAVCASMMSLLAACTGSGSASAVAEAAAPTVGTAAPVPAAASAATATATAGNAPYAGVVMSYPHSGCAYQYSPVDFCDAGHRAQIDQAIRTQAPNFNKHFILAQLDERKEYFQRSIVLIDSRDGTVYPLPIDAFSGPLEDRNEARTYGRVETSAESDTFCVSGALLVYRAFEEGRFCFGFDGVRFTGHQTAYMAAEEGQ